MDRSWHQKAVAVTGTIGSGKSVVAEIFCKLGAFTCSADELARLAVAPGSPALKKIVEDFGPSVVDARGALIRKALGKIIFSDPQKRKALEQVTHPEIRRLAAETFAAAFEQDFPLYVYECPLLFETGLEQKGFFKIITVTAPEKMCLERIIQRDGIPREAAQKRLNSQYSIEQKKAGADIILENSSSLAELELKVRKVFEQLTEC